MSTPDPPPPEPTSAGAIPPAPPDPPPPPDVVSRDRSEYDPAAANRRRGVEADRRTRGVLLVVLLACLLPVAGCGFVFAVCTVLR